MFFINKGFLCIVKERLRLSFHNKGVPYIVRGFFLLYGKGFLPIIKDRLQ